VPGYTDSHCHLNALDPAKYSEDLDGLIASARACGVDNILSIATCMQDFPDILTITEKYQNIWGSVGIHPLEISSETIQADQLIELAEHDKIIAIGETGLDFYYSADNKSQQMDNFITHLEVAKTVQLPVVVHTREAKKETIELLTTYADRESVGVLHCFTEELAMAKQALDLGFYISFSGIVTFKNADTLREVAKYVPHDRLLIETDAPYLTPVPFRGKPNEPKFVVETGNFIADLRGMEATALAEMTTDNFFRLFHKATKTVA